MSHSATRVRTIGHSTRDLDAFVDLLRVHGIERLVDVRTVPRSRRHPHFAAEALAADLPRHGIAYFHLPRLGGLRKPRRDSRNLAWRHSGFRGYADHMETAEFEGGVRELLEIAAGGATAVMCAEAVPWRCHRNLLSDALVARGIFVEHITGPGKASPHRLSAFARVEGTRVTYPADQPALPGTES